MNREEEWVLPELKKLKGSKDLNQDVEIVSKHIVFLDRVEDGGKKSKSVKSTKVPPHG